MLFLGLQMVFLLCSCLAGDVPYKISKCSIDDPELGNCIVKVAYELKPHFREGIKEIGIPSYYPLMLPNFTLSQESKLLNFSGETENFGLRGLDEYIIKDVQYDPEKMKFTGKFDLNYISIETLYSVAGRALSFPVEGNGILHANLGPINGTFEITGGTLKRRNLDYYNPKDVKIRLAIGDLNIKLGGLFGGNKAMGDMTNEMINRNSKMILDAGTPALETMAEQFVMRYFKWLMKKFPYYELFPHSR